MFTNIIRSVIDAFALCCRWQVHGVDVEGMKLGIDLELVRVRHRVTASA
jgi:hypothetical protein